MRLSTGLIEKKKALPEISLLTFDQRLLIAAPPLSLLLHHKTKSVNSKYSLSKQHYIQKKYLAIIDYKYSHNLSNPRETRRYVMVVWGLNKEYAF